jgi:hypothetical protein
MKKAQYAADTAPFYIVFGIVVTFLFLAFMWLLSYYTTDTSKIPDGLEYKVLTQRFYSSTCFGYTTKELGLLQKSIIDWNKFYQAKLDNCYDTSSSTQPQFRLNITFSDGKSAQLQTKYWSDNGPLDKQETLSVLVNYENQIKLAQLILTTQWENIRFK